MLYDVFSGWSVRRVLRLAISGWALTESLIHQMPLIGIIGSIFLLQAITNTGCGACRIDSYTDTQTQTIEFEEIK
jgi:hypothetical protein